jgi:penicillin-binding protein 2
MGQSGIERRFDELLRGTAGLAQIRVDSLGNPVGGLEPRRDPVPGLAVRLTIDIKLQRAAERAIREGIRVAIDNKSYQANGGAIVALDVRDGAVLAMASNPTYQPSVWVGRTDSKKIAPLLDAEAAETSNYPALNRVTQVAYPPGSTWKLVTALAAIKEQVLSPYELVPCPPFAYYGEDRHKFVNWDPYVNHAMQLEEAIARSCDTYFYEVGNRFYERGLEGRNRMQQWARVFGFGAPTGLDVGGESQSTIVPTPAWRKRTFKSDWDRAWNPGDSIQLAIGQKDVTVTPLQMARFYAMIANGGKLVTPYVVQQVETRRGGRAPIVQRRFPGNPPQEINIDPGTLQIMRDALFKATHLDIGTSSATFGDFPVGIAGKTGTAEKVVEVPGYPPGHLEDQAWWCGYGPAGLGDVPEIVVCAVIENGGHGGTAAAPTAMRVFEQYFGVKGSPRVAVRTD